MEYSCSVTILVFIFHTSYEYCLFIAKFIVNMKFLFSTNLLMSRSKICQMTIKH